MVIHTRRSGPAAVRLVLVSLVVSLLGLGCDALLESPFPSSLSQLSASRNVDDLLGVSSYAQVFELFAVFDNAGNEYVVVLRWPSDEAAGDRAEKIWIFDRTLALLREYPAKGEALVADPQEAESGVAYLGRPVVADAAGSIVSGNLRFRLFDLDTPPQLLENRVVNEVFRPARGVTVPITEGSGTIVVDLQGEDVAMAFFPGFELGSQEMNNGVPELLPLGAPALSTERFLRVLGVSPLQGGARFLLAEYLPDSADRIHVFSFLDSPPPVAILDNEGQVRPEFNGFSAAAGSLRSAHLTTRGVVVELENGGFRRYTVEGAPAGRYDSGDRMRSVFGFSPDGRAYYQLNLVQGRLMRFTSWW